MFLCSLVEKLCAKEENDKTGCNFNFGHQCTLDLLKIFIFWGKLRNFGKILAWNSLVGEIWRFDYIFCEKWIL